jgi:MFS family permease
MSIHAVLLIVVLNMTSFRASKMLVSLFAIELQASQFLIGVLIALYSLFPVVLALHAGKLTDRFGVRVPMIVGSLGFALALVIPFLFPVLPALYVSAVLIGVFHMMYNVAVQNLVGTLGGVEARTRNFSNYSLAMAIGVFIGPLIAGYAIDRMGHAYGYLCVSFLPLIPAFIMARARGLAVGPRVKSEEEKAVLSASLLANPVLRRTLIASAIATTAQDLFQFYLPIYGHFVGLSASAIGVVVAMAGVSAFVVRAVLPAMVNRWSVDAVFNGSLYLSSVAFLAFPLVESAPALAVLSLVLGFGMGCSQPVTLMLIFSRAPEGRSGEALGMRITINQFMHVTVPILFGSLGTALGVAPVFYINSLILAGGGWLNRGRAQHIK